LIYHVSPAPAAPERRPPAVARRREVVSRPSSVVARQAAPILQSNRSDGGSRPAPAGPVRADATQIGRNDPCYCGSGKKYKHCHMREDQGKATGRQPVATAPRSAPSPRAKKRHKR